MTQTPAGWYPDPAPAQPEVPAGQRYWDGRQWTGHVSAPPTGPMPAYGGGPGQTYSAPTTPDGQLLSGWWPRAGAAVIDSVIVGTVSILVGLPILISYLREYRDFFEEEVARSQAGGPVMSPFSEMTVGIEQLVWLTAVGLAVGLTYHALFLRWRGATPGKMVVGLQVRLRERPGQLPWSAIARRLLVQNIATPFMVIPFASLVVGWFPLMDVVWPLWDDKNQALHDKFGRTNVVRRPR